MRFLFATALCCLSFCYCSTPTPPDTGAGNGDQEVSLPSARPPRTGSIQDTLLGDWLLHAAVDSFDKQALESSYHFADSARMLFEELLAEHEKTARAINQMGRAKFVLSHLEETIRLFERAGDIHRALDGENSLGVAMAYNNIGLVYSRLRRFEESLGHHQKALAIRLDLLEENDPLTATSYSNIGTIYELSGEYMKALENFEKAKNILEAQEEVNPASLAIPTGNIGNIWQHLGQYEKALEYRFRALELWEMSDHPYTDNYRAGIVGNIGVTYSEMGDYFQARDYYLKSLAMQEEFPYMDTLAILSTYNNIGNAYNALKEHDLALKYFEQALQLLLVSVPRDHPELATVYGNLGMTYSHRENYRKAINFYRKALAIDESRKDTLNMALHVLNMSSNYYMLEDHGAARSGFEKALRLWRAKLGDYHPYLTAANRSIGSFHSRQGDYDKALAYYSDALRASRYETGDFERVNAIENVMEVLQEISLAYKAKFETSGNIADLEEADSYSRLSLAAMDKQSSSFQQQHSAMLWRDKNYAYFENAVDIRLRKAAMLDDPIYIRQAFEVAEKGKALALQAQVREMDALQFAGIPAKLIEEEEELRIAITWREKQRREALDAGYLETDSLVLDISSRLTDLRLKHHDLKNRFESDYPAYFGLKYDALAADVDYLQRSLLKAGQSLLEYLVGDSSVYIFVVTPDKIAARKVKRDFHPEQLVKQMRAGIIDMEPGAEKTAVATQQYVEAAGALHDAIFQPIVDLLSGSEQLIIIPDGELAHVPFDALLKETPEDMDDLTSFGFLLKDFQISYNHSASLLQEMKEKKAGKRGQKAWLGVAPSFTGKPVQDVPELALAPLEQNQAEILAIQALSGGEVLLGADATEEAFLASAPDYRILHLSTHGRADRVAGDDSFLAFSEIANGIEDELLFARELYNQRLRADLVVLSACETGVGELQRGEGVISLARGFSYAGARSIVTTLWTVREQPAKALLEHFYELLLKENLPKDEALRQAKLTLLSEGYFEPYYWAAFVPVGDMEMIQPAYRRSSNLLSGILVLLAGGFLLFWFRHRKKHRD